MNYQKIKMRTKMPKKKEYIFNLHKTVVEEHAIEADSYEEAVEIFLSNPNPKYDIVAEDLDTWECVAEGVRIE